jgi:hemolysin III
MDHRGNALTIPPTFRPHLRGWSHVAACVAAIALCPLVIVYSPGLRIPVGLYAGAVIALFGISAAYHRVFWGTAAHELFRRLDHAMIFVAIAASYTPIALSSLPGRTGTILLVVVWTGAAGGALVQLALPHPPRTAMVALYVLVGWAIAPVVHLVWQAIGVAGFVLLVVGGLLHTIGAVVYARERPNPLPAWFGFHELFHLLVVAAIAAHYVVIAFLVTPRVA